MFTIAQKQHIKNVQSILGFPLNRPYLHLSAQMQDWHYTEFQTALTISWLITGQGKDATTETTASLQVISERLQESDKALVDEEAIASNLELLGLDNYNTFTTPENWLPLNSSNTADPLFISKAFSKLAQALHDDMAKNALDKPAPTAISTSTFKLKGGG